VTPDALAAFMLAVLALELTPGPNMAYLTILALQSGRKAGLAAVAGVTLGLSVYLLAAVFGVAEIAAREAWLYQGLRWAGVAYLLWLAWDAWRAKAAQLGADDSDGLARAFRRGFVANALNPKAALLYVVLLPGFISPEGDVALQALGLGAIHLAVSVVIHTALVVSAANLQGLLTREGAPGARWLGRIMAVALVAVAVWMAVAAR
jgi:threonine/homoserine/homoserine lactone efflux protein